MNIEVYITDNFIKLPFAHISDKLFANSFLNSVIFCNDKNINIQYNLCLLSSNFTALNDAQSIIYSLLIYQSLQLFTGQFTQLIILPLFGKK